MTDTIEHVRGTARSRCAASLPRPARVVPSVNTRSGMMLAPHKAARAAVVIAQHAHSRAFARSRAVYVRTFGTRSWDESPEQDDCGHSSAYTPSHGYRTDARWMPAAYDEWDTRHGSPFVFGQAAGQRRWSSGQGGTHTSRQESDDVGSGDAPTTSGSAAQQRGGDDDDDPAPGFLKRLGWHPRGLMVDSDYPRWKILPAAMMNHLCLGSVFAWSIFNQPLMRLHGVVAPAALDWTMGDVAVTFSLVMGGFAWGALLGKTLDAWGPRMSCLIGGASLGAGFAIGAAAIHLHSLPLLYAGGLIWGLANGWAYVPPVATLLKWFPDRKGFAAGSTIMGCVPRAGLARSLG